MGNDMVVHSQGYGWFNTVYNWRVFLTQNASRMPDGLWVRYYSMIKQANILINNVDGVKDATQAQKDFVKGQALTIRAYCYFYLINNYQQTYKGNESKPGVPVYTSDSTA